MPRKVFVAGEILTAADVNTNLMDQAVMVFDDAAARTTAIPTPAEGMVTYLKDTNALEKYDGAAFVPVGIAPAILQVVSTTKTDVFSATSTAFTTVTGLTATITPSSTSSKILIVCSLAAGQYFESGFGASYAFRFAGGNSGDYVGDAEGSRTRAVLGGNSNTNNADEVYSFSMSYLDSPNTTSAVTYEVQGRSNGTFFVNRSQSNTDSANNIRGASTITVMEVAG